MGLGFPHIFSQSLAGTHAGACVSLSHIHFAPDDNLSCNYERVRARVRISVRKSNKMGPIFLFLFGNDHNSLINNYYSKVKVFLERSHQDKSNDRRLKV